MSDSLLDPETEASTVSVQAVPGAVFIRMKRERSDGSARRMFIELTLGEALKLRRELDSVIGIAAAAR